MSLSIVLVFGLFVLLANTQCVPPEPSISSWWRFETIGNNSSDAINSRVAAIPVGYSPDPPAQGRVGDGFRFTGGYELVIQNDDILPLDQESFTIEMWAKLSLLDTRQYLIQQESNTSGFRMFVTLNNRLSISSQYVGGAENNFLLPFINATDVWNHVAISFIKNTTTGVGTTFGYLNGVEHLLESGVGYRTYKDTQVFFGSNIHSRNRLVGVLDEISFYKDNALSKAQIQQIYNAGSSGKCLPTMPSNTPSALPNGPMSTSAAPTATICNGDKPPGAECDEINGIWIVENDIVIQPTTHIRIETSVVFQGNVNVTEKTTVLLSNMATLTFQKCPSFNDTLNIILIDSNIASVHTIMIIPSGCDSSIIQQTNVSSRVEDSCNDFSLMQTKTKLSVLWSIKDDCQDNSLETGIIAIIGVVSAIGLVLFVITPVYLYFHFRN